MLYVHWQGPSHFISIFHISESCRISNTVTHYNFRKIIPRNITAVIKSQPIIIALAAKGGEGVHNYACLGIIIIQIILSILQSCASIGNALVISIATPSSTCGFVFRWHASYTHLGRLICSCIIYVYILMLV
jgi:hypothetical protein